MKFYCLDDFRRGVEKLSKNNSYRNLQKDLINKFFCKSIDQLIQMGFYLLGSKEKPYVKFRIGGRSGYRIYYLAIICNETIYISNIHPKTGSSRLETLSSDEIKMYLKALIKAIKGEDDLFEISNDGSKLEFKLVEK